MLYIFSSLNCQHNKLNINTLFVVCLLFLALFFNKSCRTHLSSMTERNYGATEKLEDVIISIFLEALLPLNALSEYGSMKFIFRQS